MGKFDGLFLRFVLFRLQIRVYDGAERVDVVVQLGDCFDGMVCLLFVVERRRRGILEGGSFTPGESLRCKGCRK